MKLNDETMKPADDFNKLSPAERAGKTLMQPDSNEACLVGLDDCIASGDLASAFLMIDGFLGCVIPEDYLKITRSNTPKPIFAALQKIAAKDGKASFILGAILSNDSTDQASLLRGAELIIQADKLKFILPSGVLGKAMFTLGEALYADSDDAKKRTGADYIVKAAEANFPPAFYKTSMILKKGLSKGQTFPFAYKWLSLALLHAKDIESQYKIEAEMKDYHHDDVTKGNDLAERQVLVWKNPHAFTS
jgi:hypothetical protein